MSHPANEKQSVKICQACKGVRFYYLFSISEHRIVRCDDCGLVFLNPQPSEDELARIRTADCSLEKESEVERQVASEIRQAAAKFYLSEIHRYRGGKNGQLLEVGFGDGNFLILAEAAGWQVTGVEYSEAACKKVRPRLKKGVVRCGELQTARLPAEQFDLCVISDVMEHVRSPLDFLQEIYRLLKPDGVLLIATRSSDSWSARLMRQNWMEFKPEHLTYFNRQNLQTTLLTAGFRDIIVQPGWKLINFDHIRLRFWHFPVYLMTPLFRRMVASDMIFFSRKAELRTQQMLTVIVPAFNEEETFGTLMETLLRKELPNLQMEIIVVESNSTDGTREHALKYKNHPRVKLILEDKPRGKGHAVRAGLKIATGDYLLIQDADLEYDLEDYDGLLEPLVAGRAAFVLGSRHGGRNVWKMRRFTGQFGLSLFVNLGHWFFTTLVNVLFFQRLRDPFTMFKVFRRDCLYGLEFECNRFDFDFELLIKLIRKGFQPMELPVNYRSRSFKEGKKVRLFRDPLTWLAVIAWLRFVKVDPMKVVERDRRLDQIDKQGD
jgi:glycosyltransferase involved in cell wall biosynthesis/tRNA G46 methylase TrmB